MFFLFLSLVAIVVGIGLFVVKNKSESFDDMPSFVPALILVGGIALGVLSPVTVISGGFRGVQVTFGDINQTTLSEGMSYINPLSSVTEMDTRVQKEVLQFDAETSDTQTVKITVITNWRPRADKLAWLFKNYGTDYAGKIIPAAENEAVRAEIAHHKVTDLIANRPQIHNAVQTAVNTWLNKYELEVLEVSIGNIDFSDKYDEAIESKQVQEQAALQKRYELTKTQTEAEMAAAKAKGEADSKIAEARGQAESLMLTAQAEADSLKIRGEATADFNKRVSESLSPLLIQSEYLKRWDGKLPTYSLGGATPLVQVPMPGAK